MANTKTDNLSKGEIRQATLGLSGAQLKAQVKELAARYGLSAGAIYAMTKDQRQGTRKKRKDTGKRKADLMEDDGLRFAAALVTNTHCKPEDALRTARAQGKAITISLATFQKYLREYCVSRKDNKSKRRPYRRWEASEPGEIFQYDDSALKERWLVDVTTRRIYQTSELDVSKNHPNRNPNRVNLWRQVLIDDYSRRRFVRYVATARLNSNHIIDFLLEAFRSFGVPLKLYTDNAATIIGKRGQYMEKILNQALTDSGGFQMMQPVAGNSQAKGKVERQHQSVEQTERMIGVFELLKGRAPSLEELNDFAIELCKEYDQKPHSSTGIAPIIRWQNSTKALRIPPDATLNAAFKVSEYAVQLYHDCTVKVAGEVIQLSRKKTADGITLLDYAGQTVTVLLPHEEAWLVVITADGNEFTMDRLAFAPDTAGEYKSSGESKGQRTRKALKEDAKLLRQTIKEERAAEQPERPVPYFNPEPEVAPKTLFFPRKQEPMEVTQIPGAAAFTQERFLDQFAAYDWLIEQGHFSAEPSDSDIQWWKSLFANREEISETELRQACDAAQPAPTTGEVIQFRKVI